jgi:hypothetical protein
MGIRKVSEAGLDEGIGEGSNLDYFLCFGQCFLIQAFDWFFSPLQVFSLDEEGCLSTGYLD